MSKLLPDFFQASVIPEEKIELLLGRLQHSHRCFAPSREHRRFITKDFLVKRAAIDKTGKHSVPESMLFLNPFHEKNFPLLDNVKEWAFIPLLNNALTCPISFLLQAIQEGLPGPGCVQRQVSKYIGLQPLFKVTLLFEIGVSKYSVWSSQQKTIFPAGVSNVFIGRMPFKTNERLLLATALLRPTNSANRHYKFASEPATLEGFLCYFRIEITELLAILGQDLYYKVEGKTL